ncbi:MAG: cation-translocating P-type ATPase [Clostridia bacterium]|nr:cation-translocating P-type ATPase [Clostridia bacterium]
MAFSGCVATMGVAKAVVVETGLYTELGRTSSIDQQTGEYMLPIQSRLDLTGKIMNISIFVICALVFIINVIINFRAESFAVTTSSSLLNALALAVAAIPEGLPAISIVAVALGIERIIKDDIIIKKVSALETLGKTTVICADKTGIITKNSMTVDRIFDGEETFKMDDGEIPNRVRSVLQYAVACATLENDSTEASIERACEKYTGINAKELDNLFPRVAVIPFDPVRKTMTSINMKDGKAVAIVKGAPEVLADKLNNIDSKTLLEINEGMALDALRVVCVAVKQLDEIPINPIAEEIETDLTFIGLIGLDDPPRIPTIDAIGVCDTAGIRTVMITGDNPTTAKAVARRVGILKDDTKLITGASLAELSDEELVADIGKYSVFARVSPEDKLRIIEALQKSGETVTVTGDNFSDIQALTNADIGCAMGRIGTDVARGNADIIIKNSYFDSVVSAIKESRGLFANIQKAVAFLLSCNIAEIFMYLISLIIFKRPIISAAELLLINLFTDCAPVIALATGKAESKVMRKCPVALKGRLFDNRSIIDIAIQSVYLIAVSIFAFVIGRNVSGSSDDKLGMTMVFAVIGLAEIFHAFNIRFTGTIFTKDFEFKGFLFLSSLILIFVLSLLVLTPACAFFGMVRLGFKQFMLALLIAFSVIPFCELLKFLKKVAYK